MVFMLHISACFVHVYNTIALLYIFLFGQLLHIGGEVGCIVYGIVKIQSNFVWIISCLLGTPIPACLGINRHISNRLNGICKYIKERKIQCYVIWKTNDFIFLLCVCVHLLLIHFMNMDKLSSLWPVLSTKVVSENPPLKLWENFMTK